MTALPGYLVNVYLTSTTSVAFTQLALTDSGDHTTFTLALSNAKRIWDPMIGLLVETSPDGTTWTATSNYTARYVGGQITLGTALAGATPSVRVSGNYFALSFMGNGTSVDIKQAIDTADSTAFQNPPVPWKTKVGVLAGATISLNKWHIDTTFGPYLGNRLALSIYSGANATQRYECFAFLKNDAPKFSNQALNTEQLDFEVDGQLYAYL